MLRPTGVLVAARMPRGIGWFLIELVEMAQVARSVAQGSIGGRLATASANQQLVLVWVLVSCCIMSGPAGLRCRDGPNVPKDEIATDREPGSKGSVTG